MEAVITTEDLRKSFRGRKGTVEAVQGVSFEVGRGEIFGFLGPNGAGKTTTLRMLTTLLPIDSGTASVAGSDVGAPAEAGASTDRLRQPGGWRRRHVDRLGEPHPPGPPLRRRSRLGAPAGQRARRGARPHRIRRSEGRDLFGRPAPASRRRPRAHSPTRGLVPRRAHHRPRSAEPGEPVGPHPGHPRARVDGLFDHALSGRGGCPL